MTETHIHIHLHMAGSLDEISNKLDLVLQSTGRLQMEIDELEAQVAESTTVSESAITLLNNLEDMLEQAGTDKTRLAAVVATIRDNKQRLADAVVENTPAANPTPAPEPTPDGGTTPNA